MLNAPRAQQLVFYNHPMAEPLSRREWCSGSVGALNGLVGFSQSSVKPNEYTIKPELLHLKWIHSRISVKEGYIVLKLNTKRESTIDIPVGCTVRIIKKTGKKSQVLRK